MTKPKQLPGPWRPGYWTQHDLRRPMIWKPDRTEDDGTPVLQVVLELSYGSDNKKGFHGFLTSQKTFSIRAKMLPSPKDEHIELFQDYAEKHP